MDLRKAATAGTMESNDIMVTLEPAEAGGRPPIGEPLLRGPAGGLDGRVVARALEWGRRVRANEKGAPARADAPE